MGQVSSTHLTAAAEASEGVSKPATAADRALTRQVAGAVTVLNQIGFAGKGREVTFMADPGSHRPVIKVVETDTKEVVTQWPIDYVLQLAAGGTANNSSAHSSAHNKDTRDSG